MADIVKEVSKIGYKAALASGGRRRAAEDVPTKDSAATMMYLSAALLACGYGGSLLGVSPWLSTLLYAATILLMGMKPAKSAYYAVISTFISNERLLTA